MQFSNLGACESLIDHLIDNYRLLEVIGQGGMGCVYKARDEKMARIVALKVIRRNLGVFSSREGKALGQLNHPHIVNVFYMGEAKEGVFIAMEFVDGETLHKYIAHDWSEIVPILKQTLLALDHAHEAGVIHRDIKPSNIMVNRKGQVKVMDFGLAKVESRDNERTVTRLQAGTISYMSPEQVRGLQHVAHFSDIYSVGKTFYHILAGRLPFDSSESDQYSILKAIIERQFKPPSTHNNNIPKWLDRIIMKSIEKDPADRYQSALEMYQAIVDAEGRTLSSPVEQGASSSGISLSPKRLAAMATLIVALVGATAFTTWFVNRPADPDIAIEQPEESGPPDAEASPLVDDTMDVIPVPDAAMASLTIRTIPPNSVITLNGNRLAAPLEAYSIAPGQYPLTVESDGYDSFSESIALSAQTDTTLTITLAAFGRLIVQSNVNDARVSIDGTYIGSTPLNYAISRGTYQLVVRANGHAPYRTRVNIRSNNESVVRAAMDALTAFRIRVIPEGTVYINNRRQNSTGGSNWYETAVTSGRHSIRVSNDQYGTWEKSIDFSTGAQEVTVDFTQTLKANIGANVFGAAIYIDGEPIDAETPRQIDLGVGTRRIEVRREGYTATPAFIEQLIEGNESEPLQFSFQLTRNN